MYKIVFNKTTKKVETVVKITKKLKKVGYNKEKYDLVEVKNIPVLGGENHTLYVENGKIVSKLDESKVARVARQALLSQITTIKTKDDVTFDTAVVNALAVATTGIFTRGPINRVPNINFGTSAEPLSTTGLYSFCTVFTTTGNENKTTYGFKIPPVGGVADIRFPNITYGNLVAQEQLKTIFGNQSLVGGGNIDLYKHQIAISGENNAGYTAGSSCWIEFYSSNNLNADSLTDIKTLLGNVFLIEIKGACFINVDDTKYYRALYMTETSIYMEDNNFTGLTISVAGFTFTDHVTTI